MDTVKLKKKKSSIDNTCPRHAQRLFSQMVLDVRYQVDSINPGPQPPAQSHTSPVRVWEVDSQGYHFLVSAPGSSLIGIQVLFLSTPGFPCACSAWHLVSSVESSQDWSLPSVCHTQPQPDNPSFAMALTP